MDDLDWKRIWRAAISPLTLLALVLLLIWGASWGYEQVTAPPKPKPIATCQPSAVGAKLKSSQVTVNIYNGGRQRGLAGKVAKTMKARGFQVKHVDNTEERIKETVIVGSSKDDPAVKLVAQQFVKPTIREDNVPDGIVDVMVGQKYAGWTQTKAPWEIAVTENPCLAPSASPTPGTTPTA